jgi:hypothetical protein
MTTEMAAVEGRRSNVDGYTIVYRTRRAPKIHLLRAWNSCNTERRKSGRDTVRVKGSRELLMEVLEGRRADECLRCFPGPDEIPESVELIDYADALEG